MLVKDYMSRDVVTITEDKKIIDAAILLKDKNINSLIVVNDKYEPVGTLSSHTLIREAVPVYLKGDSTIANSVSEDTFEKYPKMLKDKDIKELMHTHYHVLSPDDAMIEAAANSVKVHRKIMPVVDDGGKLVGIITRSNIGKAFTNAIIEE